MAQSPCVGPAAGAACRKAFPLLPSAVPHSLQVQVRALPCWLPLMWPCDMGELLQGLKAAKRDLYLGAHLHRTTIKVWLETEPQDPGSSWFRFWLQSCTRLSGESPCCPEAQSNSSSATAAVSCWLGWVRESSLSCLAKARTSEAS